MSQTHMERALSEPAVRIVKRGEVPIWRAWLIRVIAVLLALVVCGILIYSYTKLNPIKVYAAILKGAFGTNKRMWGHHSRHNDALVHRRRACPRV